MSNPASRFVVAKLFLTPASLLAVLLCLAVQAGDGFAPVDAKAQEELEALWTNVKVLSAGLSAYGQMWDGIDLMASKSLQADYRCTTLTSDVCCRRSQSSSRGSSQIARRNPVVERCVADLGWRAVAGKNVCSLDDPCVNVAYKMPMLFEKSNVVRARLSLQHRPRGNTAPPRSYSSFCFNTLDQASTLVTSS